MHRHVTEPAAANAPGAAMKRHGRHLGTVPGGRFSARAVLLVGSALCAVLMIFVAPAILGSANPMMDTPDDVHRFYRYMNIKRAPSGPVGICSWSPPANYTFEHTDDERIEMNTVIGAFFETLTTIGVPTALRNGNALVARRQKPEFDRKVHLDVDAVLVAPADLPLSYTRELLQYHLDRHPALAKLRMRIDHHPLTGVIFGESDMVNTFRRSDGRGIIDFAVLPESLVFENDDYAAQMKSNMGLDIRAMLRSMCETRYFGSMVAAFEDPYMKDFLLEHYGPGAFDSMDGSQAYPMNLLYPRYFWRTDFGRWLYCYFGDSINDGFMFNTKDPKDRKRFRDANGKLQVRGDRPRDREEPIPGCGYLHI